MNTPPGCEEIKENAHVGATKMGFLSSGVQAFGSMDSDSKERSTMAFENSSRCHEADMQSSSVKSETSTETQRNHLIGVEDGLNTRMHKPQHTTESSCSNSSVVVPVSFSNQRYQEASREAYLLRNCGSSMDSSNSKISDPSPEEPVTASSESGVSAQIASKARRNASVRNSMKGLAMDGNHSSSIISKGGRYISHNWDDETDLEVLKKANDVKCSSRNASPAENQNLGKIPVCSDNSDKFYCKSRGVKDQDKVVAVFDLNEDITANELNDSFHPIVASVSSSVIHVVAKAGIPCGRPMKPLKFEGGLGWKGTAETSAFRPTALSKDHEHFTGIDLNVAVVEDTTHSDDDHKQGKNLWIDLNCLYDAADDSTQAFIPPKRENSPLVDLNLDTSTSIADRSNNGHWPGYVYFASNANTLMASPQILQSMEALQRIAPHTLPPHSYSTNAPFHFGSRDHPLPSRYDHESNTFHESVHNSYNTPHLTTLLHEQSSGNVSAYTTKSDGPRLFPFLSQDSTPREPMHQDSWFAASLKRKERGGGEECYPLGYKQLI